MFKDFSNCGDILSFESFNNGKYIFDVPKNFSIILKNFDDIHLSKRKILVCFTSAVTNRIGKTGPFHSGLSLCDHVGLPVVSISDYMVTNHADLSLAWYAGCEKYAKLQKDIAETLDKIAKFYGCELILIGGSGAGFACLAISSYLRSQTFVLTMNPQTNIHNYFKPVVTTYLNAALRDGSSNNEEKDASRLAKVGIISNVCDLKYGDNVKILYLNNILDDHHIEKHLAHFYLNKELFPLGDNSYIYENIGLYLGNWGKSHTPPNTEILKELINAVCAGKDLIYLLRMLENGVNGLNSNSHKQELLTNYDFNIFVTCKEHESKLQPDIKVKYRGSEFLPKKDWKYAIYVLNNKNEVIEKTGYSSTIPNITPQEGRVRIKVFVKDKYGRKITGLSNLI